MEQKVSNSTWVLVVFIALVIIMIGVVNSNKKPSAKPAYCTVPAYFYDLDSYRQHEVQEALEDVEEHGGDKFDREAARNRILAESDEQLDTQRRGELAFTQKTIQDDKECSE